MKNKEYAFWKYDQFPYVLGGEISRYVEFNGRQMVEVVSYGKGHWFKPIKILPLAEGLEIQKKLNILASERDQLLNNVNDLFETKLQAINAGLI